MKYIPTIVIAAFVSLIIAGCSGHNMDKSMQTDMSKTEKSMDEPMGKNMDESMEKMDTMESMDNKMESMEKDSMMEPMDKKTMSE